MDPLRYHKFPVPGKIEIMPTKDCKTQQDLAMAYTRGVAKPCLEIAKDPKLAGRYTNRRTLVAVITNGTAAQALAALARSEVPESVLKVYGLQSLSFGKDYLTPKRFDSRVFFDVSIAVAEAAVTSGVAQAAYPGREAYRTILKERYARIIAHFNE